MFKKENILLKGNMNYTRTLIQLSFLGKYFYEFLEINLVKFWIKKNSNDYLNNLKKYCYSDICCCMKIY